MTAAILTVGCRLNQSESDCLRTRLINQGMEVLPIQHLSTGASEVPEVVFINTCTVTNNADHRSLALIRTASRLSPKPWIIVMGCLAERCFSPQAKPGALHQESGGTPQTYTGTLWQRMKDIYGVNEIWCNARKQKEISNLPPTPFRSRALLKVQDGCDQSCSYCVVSRVRGSPVSIPKEILISSFDRLVDAGFYEIVLTGLNLGKYRDRGKGLGELIHSLLKRPGRFRIRLASIEPEGFDQELFSVITDPRVCPHFHIPLQSGDDNLLQLMGRHYTTREYRSLLERLLKIRPDANIGADVIVGFPEEDEASFQRTYRFIKDLPITYLHIFPYSPRPNTPAFPLGDPVPKEVKAQRIGELRSLSQRKREIYAHQFIGKEREGVLEPGFKALTDNYLRVSVKLPSGCDPLAIKPKSSVKLKLDLSGKELIGWKTEE